MRATAIRSLFGRVVSAATAVQKATRCKHKRSRTLREVRESGKLIGRQKRCVLCGEEFFVGRKAG